MHAEWSMSEEELRGIILEKLWTHRRKTIMFDRALKDLLIPIEIKKSILKQLERGGLIRYTFEPDTGLGSGDMTFKGFEVAEGTARPPFPIAIHQLIQTRDIRMNNASGVERMTVASDRARISQRVEKKDRGFFEWISNLAVLKRVEVLMKLRNQVDERLLAVAIGVGGAIVLAIIGYLLRWISS